MNFDRRRARDVVTEECVLRTHGLTVEEVLDQLAGCWTDSPITLADLNASEYEAPLLAFDLLGLTLSIALLRRTLRQRVSEATEKVTK